MKVITAVTVLALAPALAAAQAPEQGAFYLIAGKDTVMAEQRSRTPTELRGEFVDRVRGGIMQYVATLSSDGGVSKVSTHFYRSAADTVGDSASFTVTGDHIVAQMGSASPATIPAIDGVLPIINPSVAFLEQIVLHAKAMNAPDKGILPVFVIGAPQPLRATIGYIGTDSVTLDYAGVSMRFAVSPTGRIIGGVVPAQGVTIVSGPATGPLKKAVSPLKN